jgi:colicin import membrane protein
LPAPSPEPAPKPADQPKPEPVKQPEPKPEAVPATEVTPESQPKQEVKPDPAPETAVAEAPDAETVKLPDSAPSPDARPQPPKAQTARAPDHKDSEKPAVQEAAKPKSDEKEFNADEVAALLNKEKSAGGGAKRSTREASLGGDKTTSGEKLSQSEMDALRGQIQKCWNIPIGVENADDLKVTVQFKLDRTGKLEGPPQLVASAGNRQADESALRAVNICGQRGFNLPADKYEAWADVIVHFDPSEMF